MDKALVGTNMITFTKAQLIALLATVVDYSVTWLLWHQLGAPKLGASVTGNICGGVTHFLISRNWVFSAKEGKWVGQMNRYFLVWIGNLALNALGVWLLTDYAGLKLFVAKTITAILVAVGYNYILQKRFVFKN